MKKKRKIVRYISGIDRDKSDEDVKIPRWKSHKVSSSYVKTYKEVLPFLYFLNGSDRVVLDLVLFSMDLNNFVTNDSFFKDNIRKADKSISNNTINKSFSKLNSIGILLKNESWGRGLYQVNPVFFFKGSEQLRLRWIRRILEFPFFRDNIELKHLYYSGK